jgi:hypothetical protein
MKRFGRNLSKEETDFLTENGVNILDLIHPLTNMEVIRLAYNAGVQSGRWQCKKEIRTFLGMDS